ncbi:MAG: nitroreductase family protein [Candidatus Omnitrophota bacterium]
MSVYKLIKKRRSIRSFLDKPVEYYKIKNILESGRWAPSGLNNQPWRFVVVRNKIIKEKLSSCTEYAYIVKKSRCLILVFLDKKNSYNLKKDILAIGACVENMILCATDLGLASCWLGEILNKKNKVNRILGIRSRFDLMAVITLGYSQKKAKSKRILLDKLLLKEFR